MKTTSLRRHAGVGVLGLVVVMAAAALPAQELAVLHARSLDDVFDGIERISEAAGRPVDRQALMGMASGMFGIEPGAFLDFEKPVAVAMPVQGMMLQQNGLVAAVPVTDAAAAIDSLAALFDSHTTEGDVHIFSRADQPLLFVTQVEDTLRVGGNRDLVTGFDPLAGGVPATDLSLEIFLEPVAPMISAGLQAAKAQIQVELQKEMESSAAADEEVPIDPEAMGPLFDFYIDGVQSLLANTASIRLALDVEDENAFFSKTMVAKKDSDLAGFFAAQKAEMPETAGLADPNAALFMAGAISFDDDQGVWLKGLVAGYMDVMTTMFDSVSESDSTDAEDAGAATENPMASMQLWKDYMTAMGEFSDRWVDCWRGDMVASFDFPEGDGLTFTEIFGMRGEETCRSLIGDMGTRLESLLEDNEELAAMMNVAAGPSVGDAPSLRLEFDLMALMESSGQPMEAEAEAAIKAIYGERMNAVMANVADHAVITGGGAAEDRLQALVEKLPRPPKAPSFAPLSNGPGVSMLLNIGRFLDGMKGVIPEGELDLDGPAGALRGEAGRIPMALRFGPDSGTFELAMSMKTIEAIGAIAEQQRTEAAAAAAEPETEVVEEDED